MSKIILSGVTVGVSFEDGEVFFDTFVDFLKELESSAYTVASDAENGTAEEMTLEAAIVQLKNDNGNMENEELDKKIEQFKKHVENKSGLLLMYGVEYDSNILFLENVTVDILQKWATEVQE